MKSSTKKPTDLICANCGKNANCTRTETVWKEADTSWKEFDVKTREITSFFCPAKVLQCAKIDTFNSDFAHCNTLEIWIKITMKKDN